MYGNECEWNAKSTIKFYIQRTDVIIKHISCSDTEWML